VTKLYYFVLARGKTVFQPPFMLMRIQLLAAGSSFPIQYPAFFSCSSADQTPGNDTE
jgi:hypothetical protein